MNVLSILFGKKSNDGGGSAPPALPMPAPAPHATVITQGALDSITPSRPGPVLNPWATPTFPDFAKGAQMAMDDNLMSGVSSYAMASAFKEGLGFLGFPYLAELSQRPEYRLVSTIYARECTRKWIKLNGDDEAKIDELEEALERHDVRAKFREAAEHDGFFGRSHLFLDLGDQPNDEELATPLRLIPQKIEKGGLKNLKVVEPFWVYPLRYDTSNPLSKDFFRPQLWQVMTATVHHSRILTLVGHELPDMLKPSYAFAGLSRSQQIKPYIDNWLGTRDSVSDLIKSFSTMVLSTDLDALVQGSGQELVKRLQLYSRTRDNRGVFVADKDSEELTSLSVPLSGLDSLQMQALEQIASIAGIPITVLLGDAPSGLNASSEGELKTFYATIKGYQERVFRTPLTAVVHAVMLDTWGEIDEDITFEFEDLWEMDDEAKARIRKSDADADVAYINAGVVSNEEVRERIANDETSAFFGTDLSAPAPERPDDEAEMEMMQQGHSNSQEMAEQGHAHATEAAEAAAKAEASRDKGKGAEDSALILAGPWLALDEEHWITVHPNGEEHDGQPLLIEGTPDGGYTVKGGAGGKLNGKHVSPGSMSKPRSGGGSKGGGEEPKAPPKPPHNPARGENEKHSDWANRLSEHANSNPSEESHTAASKAHEAAAREAAKGGEYGDDWKAHRSKMAEHSVASSNLVQERIGADFDKYAGEADALTSTAKTLEEHDAARTAHYQLAQVAARKFGINSEKWEHHFDAMKGHRKAMVPLEKKAARDAKKAKRADFHASDGGQKIKQIESRFEKGTADEIHQHLKEKYGLHLRNGSNAKREYKKAAAEHNKKYYTMSPEERVASREKVNNLAAEARRTHSARVSSHTEYDIDDGSTASKAARRVMGHVAHAMDHLQNSGYDIKGLLERAPVAYQPGNVGKAWGHAYQLDGMGNFTMSSGKANTDFLMDQQKYAQNRAAKELPQFGAGPGSDPEHMHMTVAIHELAHAIGLQPHINSPRKLAALLSAKFPAGSAERHKWIKNNISEYATKNIHETDAELAALVTHPNYVRGTLPKEFEDHVDALFNRRNEA